MFYPLLILAMLAGAGNTAENENNSNSDAEAEIKKLKAEYIDKVKELRTIGEMIDRLEALTENVENVKKN